jgi:hypothetical protein
MIEQGGVPARKRPGGAARTPLRGPPGTLHFHPVPPPAHPTPLRAWETASYMYMPPFTPSTCPVM